MKVAFDKKSSLILPELLADVLNEEKVDAP
jgi:hypothetical protein